MDGLDPRFGEIYTKLHLKSPTAQESRRDPNLIELDKFLDVLNISAEPFPSKIRLSERAGLLGTLLKIGIASWHLSKELRGLVQKWRSSGPSTEIFKRENPDLWERIENVTLSIEPTKSGRARIIPFGIPRENQGLSDRESLVLGMLLWLILNPECDRLGGPCARCQRFYIKKTRRQTVYCSKRCGPLKTSVDRNRKIRRDKHEAKLNKANELIARWKKSGSTREWKRWVSSNSKSTITLKWLTRALNRGEISEP
jgi:hypothetical protein